MYIARRIHARYPIELDTQIWTYDGKSGWHSTEGTHRWTDGEAWFPLPVTGTGLRAVRVSLKNLGPRPVKVEVSGAISTKHVELHSNCEAQVTLGLSPCGGNLRIRSETSRPDPADARTLGVAVKAIEFS